MPGAGLLEPLKVYEVDDTRNEAVLRSEAPAAKGDALSYYEIRLSGLSTAVNNYNSFVASFETRSLVTARKFRDLNIEPGRRDIDILTPVEALPRYADDELKLSEEDSSEPPQIAAE